MTDIDKNLPDLAAPTQKDNLISEELRARLTSKMGFLCFMGILYQAETEALKDGKPELAKKLEKAQYQINSHRDIAPNHSGMHFSYHEITKNGGPYIYGISKEDLESSLFEELKELDESARGFIKARSLHTKIEPKYLKTQNEFDQAAAAVIKRIECAFPESAMDKEKGDFLKISSLGIKTIVEAVKIIVNSDRDISVAEAFERANSIALKP